MDITPTLERLLMDDVAGKGQTTTLITYLSDLKSQKNPLSESQYRTLEKAYNLNAEIVNGNETIYIKTESGDIVTATYLNKNLMISVKPVEHIKALKNQMGN